MKLSLISFATCIVLLSSCSPSENPSGTPESQDWKGEEGRFLSEFKVRDGWVHGPSDKPFTGKVVVQKNGVRLYSIQLASGRPLRFQRNDGRAVVSWSGMGLWVGTDAGWEEDFEERVEGLIHRSSEKPFTGKIISLDEPSGSIHVEYNYLNGVPHGPEIYFDADHKESSRKIWVQGKIPVRRL